MHKDCKVYKNFLDINISLTNLSVTIPDQQSTKIRHYWNKNIVSYPSLFNGLVFSVNTFNLSSTEICIELAKSNYAHYSYMLNHREDCEVLCKMIAVGGLILTSDDLFALGKMSKNTSFPNIIQCIGGGISKEDFVNNRLNTATTLMREFEEEVGFALTADWIQKSSNYVIIRGEMELFGICHLVKLPLSSTELSTRFLNYKKSSLYDGELEDLIFVGNSQKAIERFVDQPLELVDYLRQVLLDVTKISPLSQISAPNAHL
ncbi:MAG: hypothetical protein LBV33_06110 [Lachnospiraceae bacterium]|jgi:8-oxo-dGTP pyrophosphatase MutT (NUDIX family)|nr:hypothetical protein [Lachnospiraceae bacterium]